MLPVMLRLSREQIQTVSRTGKRISGRDWRIAWQPNDRNVLRAAVRVSTKVTKLAVQRNRMKRLLREAVRLAPVHEGVDMVMTVTRNFSDLPFSQVRLRVDRMVDELTRSSLQP